MPDLTTLVVDPQGTNFAKLSGVQYTLRIDEMNALVTTGLHGKYREQTRRGHTFAVSNTAAQAVSVALATTYTGLYLYNPPGSGMVISLLAVGIAETTAGAGIATLHLGGGYSSTGGITALTTPITPFSAQLGNGSAPSALTGSAATIVGPKYMMPLNHGQTSAALPTSNTPSVTFVDGAFEAWPGGYFIVVSLTAESVIAGFLWEEVPL